MPSVDNFGLLGDKPTHPELLDWLAARFVAGGWSLKKLHRDIVLSATYRVGSGAGDDLGRWKPRRLEAEAIRDALLAVGGLLDRTAGGPAVTHVKNREFLFDHTSKDGTKYDSPRRSLYLPVVRNNPYAPFQLFDAPDAAVPCGDRASTTVATQALFFLNGDAILKASDALAEKLLGRKDLDDAGRVRALIAACYGRPATAKEIERLASAVGAFESAFAAGADAAERRSCAWSAVCQAVLAANEFVTLP